MMSNSNYSIGLQRLARSHCVRRHLHAHQELYGLGHET